MDLRATTIRTTTIRATAIRATAISAGLLAAAMISAAGCGKDGKGSKPRQDPAPSAAHPEPKAAAADAAASSVVTLPPAPPLPSLPAGLPQPPSAAAAGAITAEQVALGALLFDEPRLASDGKTTCASCHVPAAGYSGARQPTALGRPNLRRALPLGNAAWQRAFGWDGRFDSLEEHLAAHLHGQLGAEVDEAIAPLVADPTMYAQFQRGFGRAPSGADAVTALAAFARTRYAGNSAWDAEERKADPEHKPDPELKAGYELFMGKAQCSVCHPPPLYTDFAYHRLGLISSRDEGRGAVEPEQRGAFKTPSLRDAALRPRFFHDASATSLAEAVAWHLAGGSGQGAARSIIDPALEAVVLRDDERAQLMAFLQALTSRPEDVPARERTPR